MQSVAESSRRPGLRSANTADYVKRCTRTKFGERCFSHAGPAAWNSLPASIKLTTDTNRFKKTSKISPVSHSILTFVSAPGQFVSRALQIPNCICICIQSKWLGPSRSHFRTPRLLYACLTTNQNISVQQLC